MLRSSDKVGTLSLEISIITPRVIRVGLSLITPSKSSFDTETEALIEKMLASGGVVMVTLAPEITGLKYVAKLIEMGVKVSIGHSDCGFDLACSTIKVGANLATHLLNANAPITARNPGLTGAVVANPSVFASLIFDGNHLHQLTAEMILKSMKKERVISISDAMPILGTSHDEITYGDLILKRTDRGLLVKGLTNSKVDSERVGKLGGSQISFRGRGVKKCDSVSTVDLDIYEPRNDVTAITVDDYGIAF